VRGRTGCASRGLQEFADEPIVTLKVLHLAPALRAPFQMAAQLEIVDPA
jgi:hypothetical protein